MSRPLVRVGPVHYQSLEDELEPVVHQLTGHVLDAGCGQRDIGPFLLAHGADRVTRFDPSAGSAHVVGLIERLPFATGSFDAVLCNAVLEHVQDVNGCLQELERVVRPGGTLVLAIPFLQGYHPYPGDYRRYTATGMADLGRSVGLEVLDVRPVHSFAQTLGGLLWAYADERGGRVRRRLAWCAAWAMTRARHHTNHALVDNANTYQAVFHKPHPSAGILGNWRSASTPDTVQIVPTMLVPDEIKLLHHVAAKYWAGVGSVVDAGCFLGGSTVAFADGLRRNLAAKGQLERPLIHSYDRFEVEPWTRGIFFPEEVDAGTSFREQFEKNVAPYRNLVVVHAGDIEDNEWSDGPIEVLFIDVAKHWSTCDWITWNLFPHLVPGRSLVVQQDYLYHEGVAWLHVTMELYADHFEYLDDTEVNSVVFRCTQALPRSILREHSVADLSVDEKIILMDRAAERFRGHKRDLLVSAKRHFLDALAAQ